MKETFSIELKVVHSLQSVESDRQSELFSCLIERKKERRHVITFFEMVKRVANQKDRTVDSFSLKCWNNRDTPKASLLISYFFLFDRNLPLDFFSFSTLLFLSLWLCGNGLFVECRTLSGEKSKHSFLFWSLAVGTTVQRAPDLITGPCQRARSFSCTRPHQLYIWYVHLRSKKDLHPK